MPTSSKWGAAAFEIEEWPAQLKWMKKRLLTLSNEQVRIWQEGMLDHRFCCIGVKKSEWISWMRPVVKQWSKATPLTIREIVSGLLKCSRREYALIACVLIERVYQDWTIDDLSWIENVFAKYWWWDLTDYFDKIFGWVLFYNNSDPLLAHDFLMRMMASENFWVQRIALQSQLALKSDMRIDWLFEFIDMLLKTDNFYLQRSIGWALRNAKRVDAELVADFMEKRKISPIIKRTILEH